MTCKDGEHVIRSDLRMILNTRRNNGQPTELLCNLPMLCDCMAEAMSMNQVTRDDAARKIPARQYSSHAYRRCPGSCSGQIPPECQYACVRCWKAAAPEIKSHWMGLADHQAAFSGGVAWAHAAAMSPPSPPSPGDIPMQINIGAQPLVKLADLQKKLEGMMTSRDEARALHGYPECGSAGDLKVPDPPPAPAPRERTDKERELYFFASDCRRGKKP